MREGLRFVADLCGALQWLIALIVSPRNQIDDICVSHVDPLRNEYPELASMLADPPELIGKRVRFLVAVKNNRGEVERARARAWIDGNIEIYRKMSEEASQTVAKGFLTGLAGAVEVGDMEVIPNMFNA